MREPCCVANEGCQSPAGWAGAFGGIFENHELLDLPACAACGRAVCASCSAEVMYLGMQQRLCMTCLREQGYERPPAHSPRR